MSHIANTSTLFDVRWCYLVAVGNHDPKSIERAILQIALGKRPRAEVRAQLVVYGVFRLGFSKKHMLCVVVVAATAHTIV